MKLVVGLGNPGPKYQQTRHNVGFDVLAELASRVPGVRSRRRFESEFVEVQLGSENALLISPLTYMNNSGRCVGHWMGFLKLERSQLAVLCDDMNLSLGQLRWRSRGSAGGQKGLADIIRHLGSDDFSRLRIGIDRPPPRMDPSDYVLGRFTAEQRETMADSVRRAADSVEVWAAEGVSAAMNRYNQTPTAGSSGSADDGTPS